MHRHVSRFARGSALAAAALAALAIVAAPSRADAQPGADPPPPPDGEGYGQPPPPDGGGYGQPPPPPGGYGGGYYGGPYGPPPDPTRRGLTLGFGVGLGAMDSDSNLTECIDCNYDPLALAFDFHIGAMLSPNMALVGEVFWHAQNIDSDGFNWLSQTMLVGALQFWLTPQLWIKGGLGVTSLNTHFDDGYEFDDDTIDTGFAVLGAVGFELLHSPWFAIDLQVQAGVRQLRGRRRAGQRRHRRPRLQLVLRPRRRGGP